MHTKTSQDYNKDLIRQANVAINGESVYNYDDTNYNPWVSSLSLFCPTFLALTIVLGAPVIKTLREDFYTKIGTVIHSIVQSWWPLYGTRRCTKCGKIYEGWGPIFCCGLPAEYEEYKLEYKGLSGRCDGIMKLLLDLFLLEIKSSDKEKMKKLKAPKTEHVIQANIYAVMSNICLKKKLPSPIKGHIIIYFDRANYRNYKAFVNLGVDTKHTNKVITLYRKTEKAVRAGRFKGLKKNCTCPADAQKRSCKFKNICFSPAGIEKMLKKFAKIRKGNSNAQSKNNDSNNSKNSKRKGVRVQRITNSGKENRKWNRTKVQSKKSPEKNQRRNNKNVPRR
jgi:hypothetical protein